MKECFQFYQSPLGWLKLTSEDLALKSIHFVDEPIPEDLPATEILIQTMVQLNEYFEGKRYNFDLLLNPEGTLFQQRVWDQVRKVDFGSTKNYGDIALSLGSNKFSRAVGMANGRNPLPIIIPCHRIIGSTGKLVGYSGGMERKKWLLIHEQRCLGKVMF